MGIVPNFSPFFTFWLKNPPTFHENPRSAQGKSPWIAPIPLTKYLSTTEHKERQVVDTMHLRTGISPDLSSATAIYKYMLPKMQDLEVEEAHVILMNQNFRLIKSIRLSHGGITEVSVDIRIILKEAILNNATVVAFCHNHPSGNTRPSMVDDKLTQSLKKACECMRIHFLDHVIVCDGQYYSYHENGRL